MQNHLDEQRETEHFNQFRVTTFVTFVAPSALVPIPGFLNRLSFYFFQPSWFRSWSHGSASGKWNSFSVVGEFWHHACSGIMPVSQAHSLLSVVGLMLDWEGKYRGFTVFRSVVNIFWRLYKQMIKCESQFIFNDVNKIRILLSWSSFFSYKK